jgi:tetratricopeptide (TPR) repeat protein
MQQQQPSGNAELLALQRIDETSVRLQQQGKYLEALECLERGLVLRQHFFGSDSDEVWTACKTVGEMCNLLAMTYLQQEDFAMVLELLKKAEILTERDARGRAVTFNNLACYYRRQGKLHASLTYLQKAVRIEHRLRDVENRADTHLNLCAVLSQLGRHAGALEHAQTALIMLQEELLGAPAANGVSGEGHEGETVANADRIAVLAIAYHNIGVEQEFLRRFEMSIQSYQKGVEISEKYLGTAHGITVTLRNSLLAAKRALANKLASSSNEDGHAGRIRGGRAGRRGKGNRRPLGVVGATRGSPTQRDEERWKTIKAAYGDIPGVADVRANIVPSANTRGVAELAFENGKSVGDDNVQGGDNTNNDNGVSTHHRDLITPRGEAQDNDEGDARAAQSNGTDDAEDGDGNRHGLLSPGDGRRTSNESNGENGTCDAREMKSEESSAAAIMEDPGERGESDETKSAEAAGVCTKDAPDALDMMESRKHSRGRDAGAESKVEPVESVNSSSTAAMRDAEEKAEAQELEGKVSDSRISAGSSRLSSKSKVEQDLARESTSEMYRAEEGKHESEEVLHASAEDVTSAGEGKTMDAPDCATDEGNAASDVREGQGSVKLSARQLAGQMEGGSGSPMDGGASQDSTVRLQAEVSSEEHDASEATRSGSDVAALENPSPCPAELPSDGGASPDETSPTTNNEEQSVIRDASNEAN